MPPNLGPITTQDAAAAVREWFARLGDCCARVDYAGARAIFAGDVVSFGTKAGLVTGVGPLQRAQWEGIWPNIADFRVDLATVRGDGNRDLAWGAATWTSTGFHEDGAAFDRPGRATVVLQRREILAPPGHAWLAVHTHFSLFPGTPPRTFGRKL